MTALSSPFPFGMGKLILHWLGLRGTIFRVDSVEGDSHDDSQYGKFSTALWNHLQIRLRQCGMTCSLYEPHCKEKMPKIWNKYSQTRNIGASVLISTFMCLWANYIFPRWVCLFCWRKYVDRSWEYINRSQTHECGNRGWGRAIPRKGICIRNYRCSASEYLTEFYFYWFLNAWRLGLIHYISKMDRHNLCLSSFFISKQSVEKIIETCICYNRFQRPSYNQLLTVHCPTIYCR